MGEKSDYRESLEQKEIGEGFLFLGCGHNNIHVGLHLGVPIFYYLTDWFMV